MNIQAVKLNIPEPYNVIIGMSHFIKTVRDLEQTLKKSVSGIKFGLAFCEASGPCLIRRTGTDSELVELAVKNMQKIGAGHSFIIILKDSFPIQVLNQIKQVEEVCTIHCATANPVKVLVVDDGAGRGIVGVIDGSKPKAVETEKDVAERKALLKKLGYE